MLERCARRSKMLYIAPLSQVRRWNTALVYATAVFMIWLFLHCSNSMRNLNHENLQPSVHLVLSTLSSNDYSWTENLGIHDYQVIPYMADDQHAKYHTPANQGNEAMGYLTYMHDFYDELPDISIFLHGQDWAWHVDGVLQYRTSETLNRLDLTEVLRRKYMSLRVSWYNACPNWINTSITVDSPDYLRDIKGEEPFMKDAFQSLFPGDPLPEILAAPCCSQFAVTRETVRAVPRERYQNAMSWLQNGTLSSSISGRIWEHLWQWLFLKKAVDCPSEHTTLCRNYHICFDSSDDWEVWKTMEKRRYDLEELRKTLPNGEMSERNEQVISLEKKVQDLERKLGPLREKAILTGENKARRKKIAGG
ncbi:hypothetical protein ONS95_003364 [Cadophora gregata]|uniref:uncharacterized protein n=1 Tax=Cadophora gregata TaxID=51156 RepID=UPI0026DDA3A7|nr:uncharacterized protein ONS95_003364 [Cadophora gregata]KAK0108566.1 hypothetical protein ONS95_003364 [Cadophora gregata]KAK0108840.1 hypothetical protein ONS96_002681 [Cadophora gregata f. sp. sojae]